MARILVLGGTSWLGGTVAAEAAHRGHEVICLARGQSGPAPEGTTLVRADRDRADAYAALPGLPGLPGLPANDLVAAPAAASGTVATATPTAMATATPTADVEYDLVVDVARQPRHVRGALAALSERTSNWVFVSSCSAYARQDEHGADESAQLLPAAADDLVRAEEYGRGKVACEQAVTLARGARALIVRSGLIVGAGDPSERFAYWPSRFALAAEDGGPVVVPAQVERPVQWVDVVDLSAWLLTAGLTGVTGIVNAMGTAQSLGTVLDQACATAEFNGQTFAVDDDGLVAAGVEEFMGPRSLPLWLHDPGWSAFLDRDATTARELGLRQRPLADTMSDALDTERRLGLGRRRERAGLDRDTELELVATVRRGRGTGRSGG
ncbi:MAG: NAD-dependent epimerase/dehydratase family protein [Humibacillus sp.]|nr:NAD-dependent epimerase/dehydratase family protein [Humibacillus sp.]MDN5777879.1 NAD-dependent epimerase/dehydratase family protein [Humibacillus sp.]